ncbi:MAG: hypothetical protein IKM39_05180, partial [Clostridia bacterium]|nr:hypothetical protein [Clostridia bacterium]
MEQQKNSLLSLFGEEASGETGMAAASQAGETGSDAATEPSGEQVSREEAFQAMITGEYKDLFDAK